MGFPIPAICENQSCGTVWLATSLIGGPPGASVQMSNMGTGPCPRCKGPGRIPAGVYTSTGGTLFDQSDLRIVLDALKHIQERAKQGASPAEISQEISSKHPILEPLKKYLPTNATELNAYIATLVLVATLLGNQCSKAPAPPSNPAPVVNVYVQKELSEAIVQAHAAQKTSQPSTQAKQQEPQAKPTEKK